MDTHLNTRVLYFINKSSRYILIYIIFVFSFLFFSCALMCGCMCVNIDCEEKLLRTYYITKEQQSEKEKQMKTDEI